jgi:hypothetical protein
VGSLVKLDRAAGKLTAEQANAWKQNLQQLVQQGAAGVPAIRDFLAKSMDFDFGSEAGLTLGYRSARTAMFDALQQIGGPEALSLTLQTIRETGDPREIALLAQSLEKQAPEQYRQEALSVAREALAMAAEGKLQGVDVAPLFDVFQKYGDASVIADLQQATTKWNYYGTMALAQLPDGAGIPTLIQLAQGTTSARGNALEMLAQASAQYPDARAALLDMARANKIAPGQWPYLTPMLAGQQYHFLDAPLDGSLAPANRAVGNAAYVISGNQHFYSATDAGGLTADQVNQQMRLIDELRAATSDANALKALQEARDLLTKQMSKPVAATP